MRGISLGLLMILAVAAVLTVSLRSLRKEKDRLLGDFAGAQVSVARKLGSDLEDGLQDVDEDARVIANLVDGARRARRADVDEGDRTMLASFRAMATVVRHYRSLALFGENARMRLSAIDPTETPATAAELLEMSHAAAAAASTSGRLTGPVVNARGDRYFYLYRVDVGSDTVVIAIDAPRFLQSALRAVPEGHVLIVDPGGTEWTDCAGSARCAPLVPGRTRSVEWLWSGASGTMWLGAGAAKQFGLSADSAVATWLTSGSAEMGAWRVLLVASAAALHAREQALARQFLLTALALLGAIGAVGFLIVRQQRYSAALAERLRNTETLRSLERQLIRAEKLATTGVLAAGIAHEVGTPLGIIRARAENLIDQLGAHEAAPALDVIVRQIDRISSTIHQVLDFSRAQPVELSTVQPASALRSVMDLLEHRFRQQEIIVHLNIQPQIPPIAADPNQVQQVLINLLLNACDACAKGGTIWISVRNDGDGQRLRWDLRDNGAGIQAEHLLAVFDPFFTTKKRGEGTGLGLPVAASIIRNHGGEISLSSTAGEGTTVSIVWPTARENHDANG